MNVTHVGSGERPVRHRNFRVLPTIPCCTELPTQSWVLCGRRFVGGMIATERFRAKTTVRPEIVVAPYDLVLRVIVSSGGRPEPANWCCTYSSGRPLRGWRWWPEP